MDSIRSWSNEKCTYVQYVVEWMSFSKYRTIVYLHDVTSHVRLWLIEAGWKHLAGCVWHVITESWRWLERNRLKTRIFTRFKCDIVKHRTQIPNWRHSWRRRRGGVTRDRIRWLWRRFKSGEENRRAWLRGKWSRLQFFFTLVFFLNGSPARTVTGRTNRRSTRIERESRRRRHVTWRSRRGAHKRRRRWRHVCWHEEVADTVVVWEGGTA